MGLKIKCANGISQVLRDGLIIHVFFDIIILVVHLEIDDAIGMINNGTGVGGKKVLDFLVLKWLELRRGLSTRHQWYVQATGQWSTVRAMFYITNDDGREKSKDVLILI